MNAGKDWKESNMFMIMLMKCGGDGTATDQGKL